MSSISMRHGLVISIVLLIWALLIPFSVNAETGYVNDCIENPENCEDLFDEEMSEIPLNDSDNGFLIENEDSSGSLFFEIVKLIFALLLVIVIIYLFLYFLKRRNRLSGRMKELENLGGISIGQNKSIQLVRLADTLYLLGVGEDISLIKEIKDEALIEEIMKGKESQGQEFSAVSSVFSLFNKKRQVETENDDQFKNLFQQEIDNLQQNRKKILNRRKEDQNE